VSEGGGTARKEMPLAAERGWPPPPALVEEKSGSGRSWRAGRRIQECTSRKSGGQRNSVSKRGGTKTHAASGEAKSVTNR